VRCPCASPPSKRTEGGGAALLVFNSCREEVPLSRSDPFPLRKKRVHLLVLIPLVIFLLLLLGVVWRRKGRRPTRWRKQEGKERFRGALAGFVICFKFRYLASVYSQIKIIVDAFNLRK
jgi:hypothetical protein